MEKTDMDFSLEVRGTEGRCPAGEKYANRVMAEDKIPVFSCEGACIRGEIARVAANMVSKEEGFSRCCHAETFTVPGSAMERWVKGAERSVMIDGCFLKCHGRVLENIVGEEKMVQFDALSMHKKYSDCFEIDDVPEAERREAARQVADKVLASMREKFGGGGA